MRHRKKRIVLGSPFGGIVRNVPPWAIGEKNIRDGNNIRCILGEIRKFTGHKELSSQVLNGIIQEIVQVTSLAGISELVVITSTDVYLYDGVNKTYSYLTERYNTGTVDVTLGSPIVTGTGTSWVTNVKLDDKFGLGATIDGVTIWYDILSVDSDTQVTLTVNYTEATETGQSYFIRKLLTGGATRPISSCIAFGQLFFTNEADYIKRWEIGTPAIVNIGALDNSVADDIEGGYSSSIPNIIRPFNNFMMVADCYEDGSAINHRLRWSRLGSWDNWKNDPVTGEGMAGFVDFIEGRGGIMAIETLGNNLIVYKYSAIWSMMFVGVPWIFRRQLIIDKHNVSPLNKKLIVNMGNHHIYLGGENIYIFDGVSVIPIGDEIKEDVFNSFNFERLKEAFAFYMVTMDEVHFVIPEGNIDMVDFFFNVKTRAWSKATYDITAYGSYSESDVIKWSDLEDPINEYGYIWDESSAGKRTVYLIGSTNNKVHQLTNVANFNGADIDGWFKTGVLSFGDVINFKRLLKIQFLIPKESAYNLNIRVWYSDTLEEQLVNFKDYTFDLSFPNKFFYLDLTARYFQFEFGTKLKGQSFSFQGVVVEYTTRGEH